MPLYYYNILYSTFLSRVPYKIPHPTSVHSPQSPSTTPSFFFHTHLTTSRSVSGTTTLFEGLCLYSLCLFRFVTSTPHSVHLYLVHNHMYLSQNLITEQCVQMYLFLNPIPRIQICVYLPVLDQHILYQAPDQTL